MFAHLEKISDTLRGRLVAPIGPSLAVMFTEALAILFVMPGPYDFSHPFTSARHATEDERRDALLALDFRAVLLAVGRDPESTTHTAWVPWKGGAVFHRDVDGDGRYVYRAYRFRAQGPSGRGVPVNLDLPDGLNVSQWMRELTGVCPFEDVQTIDTSEIPF